jgi:hypothetical protein
MDIHSKLRGHGLPEPLINLAASLVEGLKPSVDFFCDEWNILDWVERPGNLSQYNLRFCRIRNDELRLVAKVYIAAKRVQAGVTADGAFASIEALVRLDLEMGSKEISRLNLLDFKAVERTYAERGVTGKISTLTTLQGFAKWMQKRIGLRVIYDAPKGRCKYGRHGSEEGRERKFLPTEVIRDLFGLATHPELSFRDRFYISALVINAAVGGRINELACLPVDCLIQQEGKWVIKIFPEKGGRLYFRPFPQDLYPAVRAAVEFITEHTAEGRRIVKKMRLNPGVNWKEVKKTPISLKYYARKFVAKWVSEFDLYTPRGVYYQSTGQFVDVIQLVGRLGRVSEVAAFLGASTRTVVKLLQCQKAMNSKIFMYEKAWNEYLPLTSNVYKWRSRLRRHPHAISLQRLEAFCEVTFNPSWMREIVDDILDEALLCQLENKTFPFQPDFEFELNFARKILPTIQKNGVAILEPENSLFIIPRTLLTFSNAKSDREFRKVSVGMFQGWLDGTSRTEESLFKKFNVLDPRTGEVAEFYWHDIRHWLNTVYKQGGLSDVQVNLILGRSDLTQAQVYDHTPALSRSLILQDMIESVRQDRAVGVIQTTFNKLRIENRQAAEEYLSAAIRVVNPMPHGACAHNLALKPCQHSLSCLAKGTNGKPCEDLIVNVQDDAQRLEIERLSRDANLIKNHILTAGGELSPQYQHFKNIELSADFLLNEIFKKN